ncbi:aldehyde dehydrogenase family protein [Actomonas aquatica]|uniref:Aldehyde dehydrogenase family protein n=1 Tax=Actomonas aquatica TaxID=2866162 RepID=A0ABZ1CB21_9BACT|nr:aldehyde dehydrogenase family protein [Opitutus sp. WL0086]WRQ87789.1 aldehyde dehydrogenase family protein [Opitutus sp. WL0086]
MSALLFARPPRIVVASGYLVGMGNQPLLIDGEWIAASADADFFNASAPATGESLPEQFPVSPWSQLDHLLTSAARDARELAQTSPVQLASFLEAYADAIVTHTDELATLASRESGLPADARFVQVEIPRTLKQLRDAAACARDQNWRQPVIDTTANLRTQLEPLAKPILVMGPNNFPFAYNGIAGGDFAAAIATGHAVIAKAHPAHPGTTQRLAELAHEAATTTGLPSATVQLFYHCSNEDGLRLASDPRLGAIGFTGGEKAGRAIKAAADATGTPAYFEMSGVNPVGILPGALRERPTEIARAFCESSLLGVGQFCTNPGLVLTTDSAGLDRYLERVRATFAEHTSGPMLTAALPRELDDAVQGLLDAGATLVARGPAPSADGFYPRPAVLRVDARTYLADPARFQREMFGPASLLVVARDADELRTVYEHLDASLTGSLYSAADGNDDALYDELVARLAPRVGRLLNDKMPTGVAVSPAMMHGGPFPAGGHPGFTAVGMPASLRRFGALRCYDHVRPHRLPPTLQDRSPFPALWRCIDGTWTLGPVPANDR